MLRVLLDPDLFAVTAVLRQAFPTIRREVGALPETAWVRWPNEADVVGQVRAAPLFLTYRPALLPPIEAVELPARRVCAETWSLLAGVAISLVFSRMAPGARVNAHRDLDGPDHLRCHLGLHVAPGAWMRVDGQRAEWQEGRCIVFDPRSVHEVANDSDRTRTILILDFLPSSGELAAMRERGLPLPATTL